MLHPTTELGRRSVADGVRDLAWLPLMAGETLVGMLVAGTGTGDADLLSERLPEMNHFAAISSALSAPASRTRSLNQRWTSSSARPHRVGISGALG